MEVSKQIVRIVMFLSLLIPPIHGNSQNYAEDMKKITEKFKNGDITYNVKYCFYPFDSLKKVADSMNATCSMSGNDYYCKIATNGKTVEYCKNSRYYLVVDHSEMAIAVKKSSDAQQQMWDITKVDSLVHSPGIKISYKALGNNEGEYDLTMKGRQWDRLKLVFNSLNYTIENIYMYSSSKGKMYGTEYKNPMIGMYYTGYSEKQLNKSVFSESRFISNEKDGIALSDTYKKYKLLDYVYKLSKRS
jgi:hypothetical protein